MKQYIGALLVFFVIAGIAWLIVPKQTSQMQEMNMSSDMKMDMSMGHMHKPFDVPADQAPTLTVSVEEDPMGGYNLHLETTKFEFAPELANTDHVLGKGHAHLYINNTKVSRLYGPWFYIPKMPQGEYVLHVTLNTNDHKDYAVGGEVIEKQITLKVE